MWKIVNLDGTHAENIAKVNAVAADEPYVKYVLQVDWDGTEYVNIHGRNIILDLHGHTLEFVASADIVVTATQTQTLEVTDSSAAGNGVLQCVGGGVGAGIFDGAPSKYGIVSGGTISGTFNGWGLSTLKITGGRIRGSRSQIINSSCKIYLAPYILIDEDGYAF